MTDLTNLLPEDRKRVVRRNYFVRLSVVGMLLLALVIIMHGVMLIPAYAYLYEDTHAKEARVTAVGTSNLTPAEQAASSELATLSANAAALSSLSHSSTMSGATRLVLSVPRQGIMLSGFTLSPQDGTTTLRMMVTGTAATRESLSAYVNALQAQPWANDATLPISAYAQDADVPFTITITGSFLSP